MTKAAQAEATMMANLKEKSGKLLEQWIAIVERSSLKKHGEIVKWLKDEHGLTHGYANVIALKAREAAGGGASSGSELIAAQYSGAKAALQSIYDALIDKISKFGTDVTVAPKKAYVSLVRSKQFAMIQPSTAERIDIGIQLKGVEPTPRLESSGSFSAMVSHRVRLTDKKQIDAELLGWLKRAYENA